MNKGKLHEVCSLTPEQKKEKAKLKRAYKKCMKETGADYRTICSALSEMETNCETVDNVHDELRRLHNLTQKFKNAKK